jgi:hypothetical protein
MSRSKSARTQHTTAPASSPFAPFDPTHPAAVAELARLATLCREAGGWLSPIALAVVFPLGMAVAAVRCAKRS